MLGFDVHHVVASPIGRRVLLAAFEQIAVVHDLVSGVQSSPLGMTFDFGGNRLALSDELDCVLAAAYHVHGVAVYSATSGLEQWRRKDVKKVQRVTLSRDGSMAYCAGAGGSLVVLDLRTGGTRREIRAAHSVHESEWEEISFVDGRHPQVVGETGRRLYGVKRTTFAFLDVVFAPGLMCVSESGGPVRCFEVSTDTEKWRYKPATGSHVLCLGFDPQRDRFAGVEFPFAKGGPMSLIQMATADGTVLGRHDVGFQRDCCFALSGRGLVLSDCRVLDSSTAKTITVIG